MSEFIDHDYWEQAHPATMTNRAEQDKKRAHPATYESKTKKPVEEETSALSWSTVSLIYGGGTFVCIVFAVLPAQGTATVCAGTDDV